MEDKDYKTLIDLIAYIKMNPIEGKEIMQQINAIWQNVQKKNTSIEILGEENVNKKDTSQQTRTYIGGGPAEFVFVKDRRPQEQPEETVMVNRDNETIPIQDTTKEVNQEVTYEPVDCLVFIYNNNGNGFASCAVSGGIYSNNNTNNKWQQVLAGSHNHKRMIAVNTDGSCDIIVSPKQLVDYAKTVTIAGRTPPPPAFIIHLTNEQLLSLGNISEDIEYKMQTGETLTSHIKKTHGKEYISKIMIPFVKEETKDTSKEEEFWKEFIDYSKTQKGRENSSNWFMNLCSDNNDLSFKEMIEQAKILGKLAQQGQLSSPVILQGEKNLKEDQSIYDRLYIDQLHRWKEGNAITINVNKVMNREDRQRWLTLDVKKGIDSEENYKSIKEFVRESGNPFHKKIKEQYDMICTTGVENISDLYEQTERAYTIGVKYLNQIDIEDASISYEQKLEEMYFKTYGDHLYRRSELLEDGMDYRKLNFQNFQQLNTELKKRHVSQNQTGNGIKH